MSAFVLDASMTLRWCFADESDDSDLVILDRLRQHSASAPTIWPLEVANALLRTERARRIDRREFQGILGFLSELGVEVDSDTSARALADILSLARREGLSVYDAAYLDLAFRNAMPLATRDDALRAAAARNGVDLLPA